MSILSKLSFKDQAFKLREDAILDAATRILAGKGFDLMTMDDVALEVGLSKPSLYKHFKSKEDLVGEAMIRLLDGALDFLARQNTADSPVGRLSGLLEWAMRVRLDGGLPFLPSASPQVRDMLTRNLRYVTKVLKLNGQLEKIVQAGKKAGELRSDLPDDVILFSYYARTCDPAVEYLRLYSKMDTEAIIAHMLGVCFDGIGRNSPSR
ncbi:Biofilm operon icaADBC HTH-type negative transcriptional regulator IcaR [Andreprevotia sp. IGB-42]|uniref:TetR/AcrR family transcriptional regulator n=1 Tax=Andreprevotia sp. IGB-42 TaxID=2497473 RepID=UPI001358D1A9|nr:TetR/AcrR family transcriptional regulator [Andreprevotia sp. IGB-42]KAF0813066.1 Biofilm operon icaADBC HTH-type negative transcriptional regulator IcaR [Andreprevotia sp. IGB-42]